MMEEVMIESWRNFELIEEEKQKFQFEAKIPIEVTKCGSLRLLGFIIAEKDQWGGFLCDYAKIFGSCKVR